MRKIHSYLAAAAPVSHYNYQKRSAYVYLTANAQKITVRGSLDGGTNRREIIAGTGLLSFEDMAFLEKGKNLFSIFLNTIASSIKMQVRIFRGLIGG